MTEATMISQMWALITALPALAYMRFFRVQGNLPLSGRIGFGYKKG